MALIWAAEIGQIISIRTLLSRNENVKVRDVFQESGLHHAAANGYLDVVAELVENGADVLGRNGRQRQPLHSSMGDYGSLYPIVKYLIEKGVDVNSKDGWGVTTPHSAVKFGIRGRLGSCLSGG